MKKYRVCYTSLILSMVFIVFLSIPAYAVNHSITIINITGHGTLETSVSSAEPGKIVTVYYTMEDGYDFTWGVVVTDDRENMWLESDVHGEYYFTMPNKPVYVTGQFTPSGEPYTIYDIYEYIKNPPSPTPTPLPTPTPSPSPSPDPDDKIYNDVSNTAWYYNAVKFAKDEGLMSGVGNNTFNPSGTVTRAQVAQIIYNKNGTPYVGWLSEFIDVPDFKWYTDGILWSAKNGYMVGIGNNKFGTHDNVTREQLATVFWRYFGSKDSEYSLSKFEDANKISSYAVTAIQWAVENKYLSGKGNGILDPKGTATRAEMAQILCNIFS